MSGSSAQLIAGRSLKRQNQNFSANKLNMKEADKRIDVKAQDAQSDIVWYTTKDFHPKSLENPKVHWDESELGL